MPQKLDTISGLKHGTQADKNMSHLKIINTLTPTSD